MSQRERLIVVDGYNVLRSSRRYEHIAQCGPDYTDDTFNCAREALIKDLSIHADAHTKIVLVFDGNRERGENAAREVGNITVIFSTMQESADHIIERIANAARQEGRETIVVSNDTTIQNTVAGLGVSRMSGDSFATAAELGDVDLQDHMQPHVAKKSTVASRVPQDVRTKLEQLRDRL